MKWRHPRLAGASSHLNAGSPLAKAVVSSRAIGEIARMNSNPRNPSTQAVFDWLDARLELAVRKTSAGTPKPSLQPALQRAGVVADGGRKMPAPAVTELDAASGWAEFQAASARQGQA